MIDAAAARAPVRDEITEPESMQLFDRLMVTLTVTPTIITRRLVATTTATITVVVIGRVAASDCGDVDVRQLMCEHALQFDCRRRFRPSRPLRFSRSRLRILLFSEITKNKQNALNK